MWIVVLIKAASYRFSFYKICKLIVTTICNNNNLGFFSLDDISYLNNSALRRNKFCQYYYYFAIMIASHSKLFLESMHVKYFGRMRDKYARLRNNVAL